MFLTTLKINVRGGLNNCVLTALSHWNTASCMIKLSNVEIGQYQGEWPLGNNTCCKLEFVGRVMDDLELEFGDSFKNKLS